MSATVRSSSTGAANGPTVGVPRPTGTTIGDELWAVHFSDNSAGSMGAPSGWTPAGTFSGDLACRVWHKRVTGPEPSSYTFTQQAFADGTVHVFAVPESSTTISARVALAGTDGSTVSTPNVTPASASHLEIRVAGIDARPIGVSTWTYPSGYTPRGAALSQVFVASAAATRQINSSASSGVKVFTPDDVDAPGVGVSISIASAVTVPPVDPPPPFTPGKGSALYRYDFHRLRDGVYLDTLDLEGVTFDKRVLQPGTFSATIPIPNRTVRSKVAGIIPANETVLDRGPGVITCRIYRDGVPWGEYWITAATITRNGRDTPSITLRGSTLDAYFLNVELQEALGPFAGEDQIDIARALLESLQGQQYADLGIILQTGTSGTVRDQTYAADEATYGQRLTELAQAEDGFEWMINVVAGPFGLERHWVWGTPLGQQSPALHVFSDGQYGGDILSIQEDIDALRGATRWRARGDRVSTDASTTSTPLISASAEALAHLEWWPRTDKTVTRSSVTDMTTLDSYAAYWASTAAGALRVDSLTVALGAQPTFTPNSLGDTARIHLDNEWHLPHWRTRRIIGIGVTPTSKASGKEVARLIVEGQETP